MIYIEEQIKKQATMPWDCMKNVFAPTTDKLKENLQKSQAAFPFLKEAGVCYLGFQSGTPTRSKGTCHALFLNCFSEACFPSGVYWKDVLLTLQAICENGGFKDSVQVHPIVGVAIGHQGLGHLAYGADGAYVNGVYMLAAQLLMFTLAQDSD